ncbi:MAG: Nudt, partial [candidate division NC10 bacterium]|nr:Nudt [candidate division NC10 bacterium]
MRYEVSAGVILFRNRSRREYLLLDYGSHWDFPKGHIEAGEDPVATARRELREETGIRDARFVSGYMERMRYFYRRAGEQIRKVVIYFLAETAGEEVTLSHEHCGYGWVSYEEGLQRLTFKTAKDLLSKAHKFLE